MKIELHLQRGGFQIKKMTTMALIIGKEMEVITGNVKAACMGWTPKTHQRPPNGVMGERGLSARCIEQAGPLFNP